MFAVPPVTATVPKELLPVGTRPMLQWCLTEALEDFDRQIDTNLRGVVYTLRLGLPHLLENPVLISETERRPSAR